MEYIERKTTMADSNLIGDECCYQTEAYLNGKDGIVLRKSSQTGKDMIINLNADETQAIFELMSSIKFYSGYIKAD